MTDQQLAVALASANVFSKETLLSAANQRQRGELLGKALVRLGMCSVEEISRFDPELFPEYSDVEILGETGGRNGHPTAPPTLGNIGLGTDLSADADGEIVFEADNDGDGFDPTLAPVVRWTTELIRMAVKVGASDLHLEPGPEGLLPRFRVDGALRSKTPLPIELSLPVISRLKVLSGLDITETRMPQDGRFRAFIGGRNFDFRVSPLPSLHGEKVVLRLLDRSSLVTDLQRLGFSEDTKTQFENLLRRPHGMILVTGPTGSGKTTTLYAALAAAQDDTKNVITVEDPVEYELSGITQTPVNQEIGLTFAAALRSILRQDPDVILVGEIRDNETADIAVRAALTGHLLLSTLHTNSAVATVTRLQDMDVAPFLIASSLAGVLAQRLVRMNCRHCLTELDSEDPESQEAIALLRLPGDSVFWKGGGCAQCGGTGFKGRVAILELLILDSAMRRAIMDRKSSDELKNMAIEMGFKTLWQDGREKLLAGVTSPGEILKALMGHEE